MHPAPSLPSPFPRCAHVGQRKNGRSGGKNQIENGCAWAVLGGIPSGWEQFGAEKKWAVVIGRPRCQLNGLYNTKINFFPWKEPLHPSSHGIWSARHTRLKHS